MTLVSGILWDDSTTPSALLHGIRIFLFHDLREWDPGAFARSQEIPQPLQEYLVGHLRLYALFLNFFRLGLGGGALRGRILAVAPEQVGAREVSSAVVAEGDVEWMGLRGGTVALVLWPRVEAVVGAETASHFRNLPRCAVILGIREQCFVLRL